MALTLEKFIAELAERGVSWHDVESSDSEVHGYFQREMPDGSHRWAPLDLYDKDTPVGDHLERFVLRALFRDDDATN